MSGKTLKTLSILAVACVALVFAYQNAVAQRPATPSSASTAQEGRYIVYTTNADQPKYVSTYKVVEIGGQPFLKCTMEDSNNVRDYFRGKTSLISVSKIVSIDEYGRSK